MMSDDLMDQPPGPTAVVVRRTPDGLRLTLPPAGRGPSWEKWVFALLWFVPVAWCLTVLGGPLSEVMQLQQDREAVAVLLFVLGGLVGFTAIGVALLLALIIQVPRPIQV